LVLRNWQTAFVTQEYLRRQHHRLFSSARTSVCAPDFREWIVWRCTTLESVAPWSGWISG